MAITVEPCPKCGKVSFWADVQRVGETMGLAVMSYTCGACGHRVEVNPPDYEAAKRILTPDPRRIQPR